LLARALWSSIKFGPFARKLYAPMDLRVQLDGEEWPRIEIYGLVCSSVAEAGLHLRPFRRATEQPGAFQVLGLTAGPRPFARGLLGRSGLPQGEALLIEPCASIHTLFMRFPIDAVFLSRELLVVRAISALRPWRATRFHRGAAMAVELPEGTLARTGTREGDLLELEV